MLRQIIAKLCAPRTSARPQAERYFENRNRLSQNEATQVIEHSVGGVLKRVFESREVASSLLKNAPDVFKEDPSIAYCLHANDQFLVALAKASGHAQHSYPRGLINVPPERSAAVFLRIYEEAELHPPNIPCETNAKD